MQAAGNCASCPGKSCAYVRYYQKARRLQAIPKERLLDSEWHLQDADNFQRALEYLNIGRGVIYTLPHMGNCEQGAPGWSPMLPGSSPPWPRALSQSRCTSGD